MQSFIEQIDQIADEYIRRSNPDLLEADEILFTKSDKPLNLFKTLWTHLTNRHCILTFLQKFKKLPTIWNAVLSEMEATLSYIMDLKNIEDTSEGYAALDLLSLEELTEVMKSERSIDSLPMSYQTSDFVKWKEWSSKQDAVMKTLGTKKRASPSSGTPKTKKAKADTVISTMLASTPNQNVDVLLCPERESNGGILDALLNSTNVATYTGTTGSSIFLNRQGKLYTFKSPEFPAGEKYIDLKIYDQPSDVLNCNPKVRGD